ncbi:type II secretion system inner membrane protein GspF [Candidatus Sumerlaeota bacterium]|nr:type II secretion system inner membrane protein GspF [Candidatus Sumerlaeota bacterium]
MATFTYNAKDTKGAVVQGTMEADHSSAVVQRLQSMGYFPLDIVDTSPRQNWLTDLPIFKKRVSTNDLTTFTRQLSDLISAGVTLVRSLGVLEKQATQEALRQVIHDVRSDVERGDSLAKAFAQHPETFPPIYCAMVKAGETGGLLSEVLNRLADFGEAESELKAKIKSAMIYPMIMTGFGTIVFIVLMTYVIPKMTAIFDDIGKSLPAVTQFLVTFSNVFTHYFPFIIGGAVVGVFLFRRYMKMEQGRYRIHSGLLKVPVLGSLLVKREIARFSRTLGSLLHNGVNILPALEIVADVVGNAVLQREVKDMPEQVTQGSGVAKALDGSKTFPDVVISMMAVGEETGNLDEVLIKIADSYEKEVNRSIKTLTALIEPLIILIIAAFVGFIVMAILLPIFNIDLTEMGG